MHMPRKYLEINVGGLISIFKNRLENKGEQRNSALIKLRRIFKKYTGLIMKTNNFMSLALLR